MVKFLILFLIGLTVTDDLSDEAFMMLFQHNFYRSFFQVGNLEYSNDLEKIAQSYAESFLKNPKDSSNEYSGNTYKGSKLGENLYYGKKQEEIGQVAINTWLDEGKLYYENPENYKSASHFTQLVWKSSKLLGCGTACDTEWCCVVCNYYPAGNVINEYDTNVLPPDLEEVAKYQFKVNKEKLENETPLEKFRKKITEKHNEYRKLHNAGDLERDSKLEKIAQEHAEFMLEQNDITSIYTSEKYNGEPIGQNIFYEFRDGDLDANTIVDRWYSKGKFYDFENPGSEENKNAKQFINLVWKDTKKIGCGYACEKKDCFGLCTYYPSAGADYIYSKNVLPKSS